MILMSRRALPLLVVALTFAASPAHAQDPPTCDGPEHRQFDFWIGDWTVETADGDAPSTRTGRGPEGAGGSATASTTGVRIAGTRPGWTTGVGCCNWMAGWMTGRWSSKGRIPARMEVSSATA